MEDLDPNKGRLGCYLVLAVNITATAEGYDGVGLVLWLPVEGRYGTWGSSRPRIELFPKGVAWRDIAADPVGYLEAQWVGHTPSGALELLSPWDNYPYSPQQYYSPR